MSDNKKSCLNCKYFKQYYVKDDTKFVKTLNGHCSNDLLRTCDKRKHVYSLSACENYEESAFVEIDKVAIEKVLRKMAQNLNDIALFINNEE